MTPMTPQHDRDELREQTFALVSAACNDVLVLGTCANCDANTDVVMQLIDTHVAAIEREARIDELQRLPRAGFIGNSGIRFDAVLHSQIDNRIAQLRTTQEADNE